MDLHMPVVDGFEITRRIRASENQKIRKVPIIALTADFSAMDKEKGGKDGINDYILKPYTPEELLEKLTFFGNPINKEKGFLGKIEKDIKPDLTTDKVSKIDLTAVFEECMGEIEMLEELVALYKRNALEFIGKVKLHLQHRDHAQVQFATHKMKSGLAMMQTHNLLILVQQMNEHSKTDKNFDQMGYLYEQFLKEYPMVEFALDSEVTRLKKQA
jgi:response regulator RpfG family c-di-GMP phosphodiesterase